MFEPNWLLARNKLGRIFRKPGIQRLKPGFSVQGGFEIIMVAENLLSSSVSPQRISFMTNTAEPSPDERSKNLGVVTMSWGL
jgi:hypothetical protein